jgi:RNA polymerase sigma factor (sigma-70 family)
VEGALALGANSVGEGGDDEVFASLYPSLRRLAAVVRPAEVDADDLVQEALVRALTVGPLSELNDPGAYLRTAIVRIASNDRRQLGRMRRALRKMAPLVRASDTATYPSALDDLRQMNPRDRAVLFLSVVEERSYREIASVVGCSEQAARARASRALRRLRASLRAEGETTMPEPRELLEGLAAGEGRGASEVMRRARLTLVDTGHGGGAARRSMPRVLTALIVTVSIIAVVAVAVVVRRSQTSETGAKRVIVTAEHPPPLFSPSGAVEAPLFLVPSSVPAGFELVQVSGGGQPSAGSSRSGSTEWDWTQRWVKFDPSHSKPVEVLDVQWGKGATERPPLSGAPAPRSTDPLQGFAAQSVPVTVRGHRGFYSKANGWLAWEEPKGRVVLVSGGSTVPLMENGPTVPPTERQGFSLDELRAIAEGLQARPDGGFNVRQTPPGFQLAAQWPGFASEGRDPRTRIYQASDGRGFQIHIVDRTEEPPGINLYNSVARLITVRGRDAVLSPFLFHAPGGFNQRTLFMLGANLFVQWLEPGNTRVTISGVGLTEPEILEIANNLATVDQQAWDTPDAQTR